MKTSDYRKRPLAQGEVDRVLWGRKAPFTLYKRDGKHGKPVRLQWLERRTEVGRWEVIGLMYEDCRCRPTVRYNETQRDLLGLIIGIMFTLNPDNDRIYLADAEGVVTEKVREVWYAEVL